MSWVAFQMHTKTQSNAHIHYIGNKSRRKYQKTELLAERISLKEERCGKLMVMAEKDRMIWKRYEVGIRLLISCIVTPCNSL